MLGAQKKTLSGFSSATVLPHTGLIYYSEIVQSVPSVSDAIVYSILHMCVGVCLHACVCLCLCERDHVCLHLCVYPVYLCVFL